MKLHLLLVLTWLARFAPAQAQRCVEINGGDRIVAADFAKVLPGFAGLPADTPIATAPLPGVRRVFHAGELTSLAKRYAIDAVPPGDSCFEREMETLDRRQVEEAMRRSLGLPDARIEVVETSAFPVPRGRLEFRRESLGAPASVLSRVPVTWRGNVIYGENRRYSIWARVMLSAVLPRVVAAENLKRGEPVAAGQLRTVSVEVFPGPSDVAQSVDEVAGRIALRDLSPGAEVHLSQLAPAADVHRGDDVHVEVRCGNARLAFVGKAESAGRVGEMIKIRNLVSNSLFQARVNGPDTAFVNAGPGKAN